MRALAVGVALLVCWSAWATVQAVRLYESGQQFERDVASEQLTDPSQIWTRWAELSKDSPNSLLLSGPRAIAREKFVAAADRAIATYRINGTDLPYESWHLAQTMLLHALATDTSDKSLHGKLRLCEGHISVVTRHGETSLNDAVREYQEAQQLLPQSPDPPLALARLYLYLLTDPDKAATAFQQSEETKGYTVSGRERTKLADEYRDRGNLAWKTSYSVFGQSAEKDQIQEAANDYQKALELYQKAAGWGNSASRVPEMQSALDSANNRLRQIEQGQDPDAATVRHNIFAGAVRGIINALRDKSTKKGDQ
jgi:tetratricopeptide (TPR) repeat protein